jgi:hypothetical protein
LYWRLAPPRGVRPDVAYAQAAKETAFGRFGGVLDASYHNPCGLKRPAGGGNFDPFAHERFRTWRTGVTAHLDHLALYAGARGFPRAHTPDPRQFRFLYGRARTVGALGSAWAPAPEYGRDVARLVVALDGSARAAPRAHSSRQIPARHSRHVPAVHRLRQESVLQRLIGVAGRLASAVAAAF